MHEMELAVVNHLADMKKRFDVVFVKAEFEAQGMSPDELKRLDEIANAVGLTIALKVGGAEAVTDLKLALQIGVGGIIFPMVETSFALQKALDAAKKYLSPGERKSLLLAVNIETETACNNLTSILGVGKAGGLDAVTVGRVDLVGSLGFGRNAINSNQIYQMVFDVCLCTKSAGLKATIGGGVEVESYDFINRLVKTQVLDRFETRMIVFPAELVINKKEFESAIRMAHKFELLWSECWVHRYSALMREHQERSVMLKKRIGEKWKEKEKHD